MTNTIFKADNITHDYKDKKKLFHAIKNISFELHAGEVISLLDQMELAKQHSLNLFLIT